MHAVPVFVLNKYSALMYEHACEKQYSTFEHYQELSYAVFVQWGGGGGGGGGARFLNGPPDTPLVMLSPTSWFRVEPQEPTVFT